MASHKTVVENWYNGKSARGYSMDTDGQNLYSYAMKIGRTLSDGTKQALDLHGYYNVSSSTAKHSTYAERVADEVILPKTVQGNGYEIGSRFKFPQPNELYEVFLTNKTWKTEKGAKRSLGESLSGYVEFRYGSYVIMGKRQTDEIGHVSVAYFPKTRF